MKVLQSFTPAPPDRTHSRTGESISSVLACETGSRYSISMLSRPTMIPWISPARNALRSSNDVIWGSFFYRVRTPKCGPVFGHLSGWARRIAWPSVDCLVSGQSTGRE